MAYIHRYASPCSSILEVGAGTGRYSIALAKEGMDVNAVKLVEHNLALLREMGRVCQTFISFSVTPRASADSRMIPSM
jgi:2-polyprenyl-3-methyl-5-hydroxy-6-metoxy-1,4-benzoquinol methylase